MTSRLQRVKPGQRAIVASAASAAKPVYTALARDATPARWIAGIRALKRKSGPVVPLRIPAGCAA